ncbi:MAG: AMP-binding protein, partial [Candidatus Sulfotelmatobacter sp.]
MVTKGSSALCVELPIEMAGEDQAAERNRMGKKYGEGETVVELFEAAVRGHGEAVAVVFGDEQLSYEELNGRANQVARYLREQGVGAEVLVGICVERSLEMVVGLLGILKAGGAYVPLDPGYPEERLKYMMEDAQVSLLLTQERTSERV